jgi:hypothetical protein
MGTFFWDMKSTNFWDVTPCILIESTVTHSSSLQLRGRGLSAKFMLALASTAIHGSEFNGTHDHI